VWNPLVLLYIWDIWSFKYHDVVSQWSESRSDARLRDVPVARHVFHVSGTHIVGFSVRRFSDFAYFLIATVIPAAFVMQWRDRLRKKL
jgi:hypothetical protein